jgi:hypothetical protein
MRVARRAGGLVVVSMHRDPLQERSLDVDPHLRWPKPPLSDGIMLVNVRSRVGFATAD